MTDARADLAMDLADHAEAIVRRAEAVVEAARDPTERDVAATRLDEALALQDEVLADVAPALEARERRCRESVREALRSLGGDPGARWDAKHRRLMSPSTKARLIAMIGKRRYLAWLPL